jgi:choline dehydrogenase-like flavoprotein
MHDVIVVGSGAAGGMSSYVLANKGLNVLMLEGGRDYSPEEETPMFDIPASAPLRGVGTPDKAFDYYAAEIDGGWEVPNEPYTVADGSNFRWFRNRVLGGKTNLWGRVALRFGPYDFEGYSRDGLGVDWPISYDDLAPWYDKTERLVGVCGDNQGFENVPETPPGILQPPPPIKAGEYFLKRGFESMGMPVTALRSAKLTQPLNGRAACFYATDCMRGCSIKATFQSPTVLISPALETGNLDVRTNSLVYRVDTDKSGKATGVSFVDRTTGEHHSARGKSVVLAASAYESVKIMMNSRSGLFPDGLSNEYGHLGRHLMDTPDNMMFAYLPALEKLAPRNDDGMTTPHIYVPWWGYPEQARGELSFSRGYHVQLGTGRYMPRMSTANYADHCESMYGPGLREDMRRRFGTLTFLFGLGEMIPNERSYCELDPDTRDKWGNPVLRFHWDWGEHAEIQMSHVRKTFLHVIDRLGGELIGDRQTDGKKILANKKGGEGLHEVGGARMGFSEKDSVVNQFGQAWNIKNLFVVDGSIFPTNPDKNPTITIMALAWRCSDYLAEEAAKGNL